MKIALLVVGLMVLGLLLMAIEVLVIPGFGVVGALGVIAMIAACVLAFYVSGPGFGALALLCGTIGAGLLLWLLPKTKTGRKMVLKISHDGSAPDPELPALLDREGVVISDLRPAGVIKIDGRPIDVVSDGQYVESGTRVRVVRVEGVRVVVEPMS